jgi:hypothetical protein
LIAGVLLLLLLLLVLLVGCAVGVGGIMSGIHTGRVGKKTRTAEKRARDAALGG